MRLREEDGDELVQTTLDLDLDDSLDPEDREVTAAQASDTLALKVARAANAILTTEPYSKGNILNPLVLHRKEDPQGTVIARQLFSVRPTPYMPTSSAQAMLELGHEEAGEVTAAMGMYFESFDTRGPRYAQRVRMSQPLVDIFSALHWTLRWVEYAGVVAPWNGGHFHTAAFLIWQVCPQHGITQGAADLRLLARAAARLDYHPRGAHPDAMGYLHGPERGRCSLH
jgi:hypothetical protein